MSRGICIECDGLIEQGRINALGPDVNMCAKCAFNYQSMDLRSQPYNWRGANTAKIADGFFSTSTVYPITTTSQKPKRLARRKLIHQVVWDNTRPRVKAYKLSQLIDIDLKLNVVFDGEIWARSSQVEKPDESVERVVNND
jgi:hypothetical protein